MVCIVDYGMGNLRSVEKAFLRLGSNVVISNNIEDIQNSSKLIIPGVGHFEKGMENIRSLGLKEILDKKVLEEKVPILGICLGMQLFTTRSEEAESNGFGWIKGESKRFKLIKSFKQMKIPHMGWNEIDLVKDSKIFEGDFSHPKQYFVHSYFVKCEEQKDVLFETKYGEIFHSGFEKDNIIGVQFHPEKSHSDGLKILKNFIEKY